MSYKNVKGILVEIGGDTSALQNALKKVDSATSSLSKELRGINSLLKLDPSNTELLAQKQTVLTQEISETEEKLKSLQQAQKEADEIIANGGEISQENYRALQREIIETEERLKRLKLEASDWTQTGRKIEEVGENIENVGSKIDNLGSKISTKITLPIVALATASIKTASDFESSMRKVAATMGITADEIENGSESYEILEEAAKKCGETTKYSATEAADALNYLALAGYDAKKSAEVLPKVLNLAAAGDLELATASDMVTDAMAALNLETQDLDKYINEMAKTSQKSNTSVAQLGEATLTCAGTVNLARMSLETMNAELGILANNGIKGAEGGTHLRNIILSLTSPIDEAAKSLENLGIEITDSSGNIRDLNDIMSDFNSKLDGLSDEKKTNIISTIFNKTDISAVNALIKGSGDEFSSLKKEISNCDNAAQDMADTMNSSLEGQITLLKSQVQSIAISTGKKLMPTVKKIIDKAGELAEKFNGLSDSQRENVIKIGLMVAAAGPLIKILGTVTSTTGKVVKGIGTFSQAVGVMKTGVNSGKDSVDSLAGMLKGLTSPAGIATGAIGLVVAALALVKAKIDEELSGIRELNAEIQNNVDARQSTLEAIDEQRNASLSEIDNVQALKNELSGLVDENGKVKEGYEARAKFILEELNQALGTEYELNNKNIKGYKKLKDEIDELILKKKAQIILEANEEKYKEAVTNKAKAYEEYLTTQKQINEMQEKYNKLQEDARTGMMGAGTLTIKQKEYREELEKLNSTLSNQEKQLQDYSTAISQYETNSELMIKGGADNLKKIEESVSVTQKNITDDASKNLQERIQKQLEANVETKKLYDLEAQYNKDTKKNIYKNDVEQGEKDLQLLINQLAERTNTVGELGEQEINAWKSIATNSYDKYSLALAQMPPETKRKIEEATGIISNDKTVEKAMKELAEDAESGFTNNVDGKKWGSDLIQLISAGMTSDKSRKIITSTSSGVAGLISSFLHFSVPDQGPLADMDKSMPDMINLMAKGIDSNKNRLVKSAQKLAGDLSNSLLLEPNLSLKDFSSVQGKLNRQIINSNKVINNTTTTIQPVFNIQGTNAKEIADEVNRQLGKLYL